MKTTDFVVGKWSDIFAFYGLPPITGKRHFKGECPLCSSKGSFRVDDKEGSGSFICKCQSGTGWKLLQLTQGKEFKDLAREIDSEFGNAFIGKPVKEKTTNEKLQDAINKYRLASPIKGTGAQKYLNGRGIYELPARAIKANGENMIAIATDAGGNPIYSHETFINDGKKANVAVTKKMMALQSNNITEWADCIAIRMFEPASCLGIAEGIETALSARQIYKCNVWSTMNSGFMKKFIAPCGVEHLMIFADNDKNGTGLAAAFECGSKNIKANNDVEKVTIRWTGDVEDFNDMLQEGSQVFEWKLSK